MLGAYFGIHKGRNLVIFVSPKAGCTTAHLMCQWLFGHQFERMDRLHFIPKKLITLAHCKLWQKDHELFVVIRNPYDRLLSCFYNKFVNYNGKILSKVGDLEGFSKNLLRVANYDTFSEEGITFGTFVKILADHHRIDPHWDCQFNFPPYLMPLIQNQSKLIKLEEVETKTIQYFSLKKALPVTNRTNLDKVRNFNGAWDIQSKKLDRYFDRKSMISDTIKERIDRIYQIDFELGRYEKIL